MLSREYNTSSFSAYDFPTLTKCTCTQDIIKLKRNLKKVIETFSPKNRKQDARFGPSKTCLSPSTAPVIYY